MISFQIIPNLEFPSITQTHFILAFRQNKIENGVNIANEVSKTHNETSKIPDNRNKTPQFVQNRGVPFRKTRFLVNKQHFAVFRQRPKLVRHDLLEAIHHLAEVRNGRNDALMFTIQGCFYGRNGIHELAAALAQRLRVAVQTGEALVQGHFVRPERAGIGLDHLRQDDVLGKVAGNFALDVDALVVILDVHLVAGTHLGTVHHPVLLEQGDVFVLDERLEGFHGGADVREAAAFCFLHPFVGIAVAVVKDTLVFLHNLLQQLLEARVEVLLVELFELFGNHVESFGHNRVEHDVRLGTALAGTGGAEFELVAGKRKRRSAVTVGGIARERRQHVGAELHGTGLLAGLGHALLDLVDHVHQLVAQVDGDDGRRRLVRTETVVVARAGTGHAEQVGMGIHGVNDGAQRREEHGVLVRVLARIEQVALAVRKAPVVVLARAVHTGKRLFVQQAHEPVTVRHVAERFHDHHVVVASEVHVLENRGKFELRGGDFVMAGLGRDTEAPKFLLHVVHEIEDAARDAAKVVVVHLLVLRGSGPEDGTAGLVQVGALQVETLVDQEVFLFGAERHGRLLGTRLEAGHETACRLGKCLEATEQRRLLVESLARVAAERCRDAERGTVAVALDECRGSRVPGGIAAGLESRPESATREAGGVGLTHDEVLAAKRHDGLAAARFKETVVLFGSGAGQRLEPVRKVRRAAVHGPLFHRMGDVAGDVRVESDPLVDRGEELFADILRQVAAHGVGVENVFTIKVDVDRFGRFYRRRSGSSNVVNSFCAIHERKNRNENDPSAGKKNALFAFFLYIYVKNQ